LNDSELITLEEWYYSIINKERDIMSPPPGCADALPAYGMGAYDGNNLPSSYALVEVRGYSRMQVNGVNITVDNVDQIIKNESSWFFGLD